MRLRVSFGFQEKRSMNRFHKRALAAFVRATDQSTTSMKIHRELAMNSVVSEDKGSKAHGLKSTLHANSMKFTQGNPRDFCLITFSACKVH